MQEVGSLKITKVPVEHLHLHPHNARQGDVGAIMQSLKAHGQYRPIVVQKSTMNVLAGNHTLQAATQLGWKHVEATIIDVDDDQALRILLVDNRSNDLATYDKTVLADILEALARAEFGLEGTGFYGDDLDDLLLELNSEFEPKPEPELDTSSQMGDLAYRVVVECRDEMQQEELISRFQQEGLDCKALIS